MRGDSFKKKENYLIVDEGIKCFIIYVSDIVYQAKNFLKYNGKSQSMWGTSV